MSYYITLVWGLTCAILYTLIGFPVGYARAYKIYLLTYLLMLVSLEFGYYRLLAAFVCTVDTRTRTLQTLRLARLFTSKLRSMFVWCSQAESNRIDLRVLLANQYYIGPG